MQYYMYGIISSLDELQRISWLKFLVFGNVNKVLFLGFDKYMYMYVNMYVYCLNIQLHVVGKNL